MMLFQLLRQDVLEMCDGVEKRPTVKDILTKFDSAEGTLHKNVLKVSKEIHGYLNILKES